MCTTTHMCVYVHTWSRSPSEMFAIRSRQWAGIAPGLWRHAQHLSPSTGMRLVRCDVAAVCGVHVVSLLSPLETRSDHRRHAAVKSQAGVGECTRCGRPVTLTDEFCDPTHESAQTGNGTC
jgi:hypothetical protein